MADVSPPAFFLGWLTRQILPALAVLFLAFWLYAPVTAVLDVTLDASNYGSYSAFTASHRQYGPEVVPMAGPLGFVIYGTTYAGHLYWTRLLLELCAKLAFALLAVWYFRAARSQVVRWIWLAGLLVFLPGSELVYDFTVLFAGLFVVLNYQRTDRLLLSCAATALLAFLALTKGTLLVFALATLGFVALQAVVVHAYRRLVWLLATFAIALLVYWIAAGQDPRNLPSFVQGVTQLSRGYNDAMGLQEPPLAFATGAGSLLLLWLALTGVGWTQRRRIAVLLAVGLVAGFSFLKWKHGFVRADGHVYLFYFYAVIGAPTAWLLGRTAAADPATSSAPGRWSIGLLAGACAGLAFYGPGPDPFALLAWQMKTAVQRLPVNASSLWSPQATRRQLESDLQTSREVFTLAETRRIIGRSTIDFFGFEHGYLALNGLNDRPRPMSGGTFNVLAPQLQERNARFVSDVRTRPNYFLLNLQTIDNRLLTQDDGSTLWALVQGYAPIAAEQGMLLLQAQPAAAVAPAPRVLSSQSLRFGELVNVPALSTSEILLVSFEFPPSPAGRLRAALYKPSALYISLEGVALREPESRRLVPSLASRPLILSPMLETTGDLLTLYSGQAGKTVQGFRVYAQWPGAFDAARARVTFYTATRPPALSPDLERALTVPLRYPMANRDPALVVPTKQAFRVSNGLLVQRLETPGRIVFSLDGHERAVSFDFGLDPECYTRGQTDGVDFSVVLLQPGGSAQVLYRQALHPCTVPADRGPHRHRLILPPIIKPGSQLTFHADPGPDGNNAWDWAYFTKMRFESGPLLVEQFPGFNLAPSALTAEYCGAMAEGDGSSVFMLNAVGELTFILAGSEHILTFTGGLRSGAYTEGNTDGAEFVVELEHPDGRRQELLRRWLRPKTVPADQGKQLFSVSLPTHLAGTRLHLRTLGGPAGNLAWDWTYLASLVLQ